MANTSGVPDYGLGILAYPNDPAFPGWFDFYTKTMGVFPKTILVYCGDFSSIGTMLNNLSQQAAAWQADPRCNGTAFTDTNGVAWSARPRLIPVIGYTTWTTSEDMTFQSAIQGQNDPQIAQIFSLFFNAGFHEVHVRINYEDEYPTTPAGINSSTQPGSGQFQGKGASWAQGYAGNTTAWNVDQKLAWRHHAKVLKTTATSLGGKVVCIWGPTFINATPLPISEMDPDDNTSDGLGYLVDAAGPDFYWGNFFGDHSQLRTGYDQSGIFNGAYAPTGPAANIAAWSTDVGSVYYGSDFFGGVPAGYSGPFPALPGAGNYSRGWGWVDVVNYILNRKNGAPVIPLTIPEHGVLPFNGVYFDPDASHLTALALPSYLRSRIQAVQTLGIPFLNFNLWTGHSHIQVAQYGVVFPELLGIGVIPSTPITATAPVVNPNPVTAGRAYSFSSTKIGAPWIAPKYSSQVTGAPVYVSPSGTVTMALTNNNRTVTFSGLTSGIMQTHQAFIRDSDGTTTPPTTYNVVPVSPGISKITATYTPTPVVAIKPGVLVAVADSAWDLTKVLYSVTVTPTPNFMPIPATSPVTLSADRKTLTISNVTNGLAQTHYIAVKDTVTGTVSNVCIYNVVATQPAPMTAITATFSPNPVAAAQVGTITAVADGPFSSLLNVQYSAVTTAQTANFVAVSGAVTSSVSPDGRTVTITGVTAGLKVPHVAAVKDAATGITSNSFTYNVV